MRTKLPFGPCALLCVFISTPLHAVTRYVNVANPAPLAPYTTWTTAATVIQDAVDAAQPGDEVVVTNGVYEAGGRMVGSQWGVTWDRVAVTKPLILRSVNGPEVTVIRGYQVPGTTNGDGAVRCVNLNSGSTLIGFTLTNGATLAPIRQPGGITYPFPYVNGGGALCEQSDGIGVVISNCIIVGNSAGYGGGGVYQGTLINCRLSGNSALDGGGAYTSTLINCIVTSNSAGFLGGGGTTGGTLNNCLIKGNSTFSYGGGARSGTLNNCTLVGNSARNGYGGGVVGGTLNNCLLTGNSAYQGGGAYGGTLMNCTVVGNSADASGGGVMSAWYSSTPVQLGNCIVYYNRAGQGANYSDLVLFDSSCTTPLPTNGTGNIDLEPGLASIFRLSAESVCRGSGSAVYAHGVDIDGEVWRSPPSIGCDEVFPGAAVGPMTVSIQSSATNVLRGGEIHFAAQIDGKASASRWEFGDGTIVSNRPFASHTWLEVGTYDVVLRAYNEDHPDGVAAAVSINVIPDVYYAAIGNPNPVWPHASWDTAATNLQDAVDAASAIPESVRRASAQDILVLVSNGVYETGGRAMHGQLTNRVAVMQPLTLRSVNGPDVTVIRGYQVPGTTNGDSAVRCVSLTNGSALIGFTLTGGATRVSGGSDTDDANGGGVWCVNSYSTAVISNCVIASNSASLQGGGAYNGTLIDCLIRNNTARVGGGAAGFTWSAAEFPPPLPPELTLKDCTIVDNIAVEAGGGTSGGSLTDCTLIGNSAPLGGGAEASTLDRCRLAGNSATAGGGTYRAVVINCNLSSNSALFGGGAYATAGFNTTLSENVASYGGGVFGGTLNNCTLTRNSATNEGGGVWGKSVALPPCIGPDCQDPYFGPPIVALLNNCIVYSNRAPNGANNFAVDTVADLFGTNGVLMNHCCTMPLPTNGVGNITNAPLFVDAVAGNFRLQSNSPCINAGRNADAPAGFDLDGNPRIVGGTVDMGAYEFQSPESLISYAWRQLYFHDRPPFGWGDFEDADSDGQNNWQEWRAGTNPRDSASSLRLLTPLVSTNGLLVRWQSVSGRQYFLERRASINTPEAFSPIASTIPGQANTTIYTDTNAVGAGLLFYRVGIQE